MCFFSSFLGLSITLCFLQALGLTGLGALQNQLLQQGLTANDLATVLTAQAANVNTNALSLGNSDLGSSLQMNNSALSNNVLGNNQSLNSGPLSGTYLIEYNYFV